MTKQKTETAFAKFIIVGCIAILLAMAFGACSSIKKNSNIIKKQIDSVGVSIIKVDSSVIINTTESKGIDTSTIKNNTIEDKNNFDIEFDTADTNSVKPTTKLDITFKNGVLKIESSKPIKNIKGSIQNTKTDTKDSKGIDTTKKVINSNIKYIASKETKTQLKKDEKIKEFSKQKKGTNTIAIILIAAFIIYMGYEYFTKNK